MNRASKIGVGVASALVLALAGVVTTRFEGHSNEAYPDPATRNAPYTACWGSTKGVHKDDVFTDAQCEQRFHDDQLDAAETVQRCIPNIDDAPISVKAALDDFAFNVGPGKAGASSGLCVLADGKMPTIRRHALAGQWAQVCKDFGAWVMAGGRKMQGLVNRRAATTQLCEDGLR